MSIPLAELPLRSCNRCKTRYSPNKSTSTLRLTYCGLLCEKGDLGFSMESLLRNEFTRKVNVCKQD